MSVIHIPRRHYKQPQGTLEITSQWSDIVLSAAIGGTFFNLVTGFEEASASITSGVNQGGACDVPSGTTSSIIELATPGTDFLLLSAFSPPELSGIKQVIAYDASTNPAGNRRFQFRTNGTNLEFIRFNTVATPFSISSTVGIPAGDFGTIIGWSNGLNFGVITPGGEASSSMTGTPSSWGFAQGLARWFSRRANNIQNEGSIHQTALRAVLRDNGSQEIRRELQRNPWQIFRAQPRRIYTFPSSGIPTINSVYMSSITNNSAIANVSLVF